MLPASAAVSLSQRLRDEFVAVAFSPDSAPSRPGVSAPQRGPIRHERTLRSSGHHTIWGDPWVLLECVGPVVLAEAYTE